MEQQLEAREEGGNGLVLSEKRRRGRKLNHPDFSLTHAHARSQTEEEKKSIER